MIVVKTNWNGDIRRITKNEFKMDFAELTRTIGSLYKIKDGFSISYVDEEGDNIQVESDEELQLAIQYMMKTRQSALKLKLSKCEPRDEHYVEEVGSDLIKDSSPEKADQNMDSVLTPPNFPKTLEECLNKIVYSEQFLDALCLRLVPKLVEAMQNQRNAKNSVETEICSAALNVMKEPSLESFHEEKEETEPLLMHSDVPELQSEQLPEEESPEYQQLSQSNESDDFPDGQEPFVIVKDVPNEEAINGSSNPLVNSFVSLFNKFKGSSEKKIPNVEQLLKQLEDMGFDNREANMKSLQFHYKYNEGLDEVIEDLLQQRLAGDQAQTIA